MRNVSHKVVHGLDLTSVLNFCRGGIVPKAQFIQQPNEAHFLIIIKHRTKPKASELSSARVMVTTIKLVLKTKVVGKIPSTRAKINLYYFAIAEPALFNAAAKIRSWGLGPQHWRGRRGQLPFS